MGSFSRSTSLPCLFYQTVLGCVLVSLPTFLCTFALCTVCYVGFSLPTFLRTFALCTRLPYRSRPSAYLIKFISKNVPYFFGAICCGGKTQIRFKDQYHIGVSHTRLVLLNTSGLIRAQRGLIGTTCAKHPFG